MKARTRQGSRLRLISSSRASSLRTRSESSANKVLREATPAKLIFVAISLAGETIAADRAEYFKSVHIKGTRLAYCLLDVSPPVCVTEREA